MENQLLKDVNMRYYKTNANPINLDIILISYNTVGLLKQCLSTLYKTLVTHASIHGNVFMVDNASFDDSLIFVKTNFPQVTIIENKVNLGYAKAVNMGIKAGHNPYILVINSDLEFEEQGFKEFIQHMIENDDVGLIGPQLIFRDGGWQKSSIYVQSIAASLKKLSGISELTKWVQKLRFRLGDKKPRDVEAVQGAAMLIRRSMVEKIGGFDEDFFFYSEDIEFCHRVHRHGYHIIFYPLLRVIHLKGGSSPDSLKFLQKCLASDSLLIEKIHPNHFYQRVYAIVEFIIAFYRYLFLQIISLFCWWQWPKQYKKVMEIYLTHYGYYAITMRSPQFDISTFPNRPSRLWKIFSWILIILLILLGMEIV